MENKFKWSITISSLVLLITLLSSVNIQADVASVYLKDTTRDTNRFVGTAVHYEPFSNVHDETYKRVLAEEFNMLVHHNMLKMHVVQRREGIYDFERSDAIVDFAQQHGMAMRGHTLIWHNSLPVWFEERNWTRSELLAFMEEYITTVMTRYRGKIQYWDVVNEAVFRDGYRNTIWYRVIGPEYIAYAFEFAHAADPDAILYYNDFHNEDMGVKSNAVYAMVANLIADGVPIHGVGMQAHIMAGDRPYISDVRQNIERLAALGLEVQFTEVDVSMAGYGGTEQERYYAQAHIYSDLAQACAASTACTGFITWGFTDLYSWKNSRDGYDSVPLLFDDDYNRKPAYYTTMDALAAGVPVNVSTSPNQNSAPVIQALAGQTNTEGDSVSLQVVANDPDGHTLRFTDENTLPNGLRIDATSGLISGTITSDAARDAVYPVVIRAVDTEGQVTSMGFSWMVLPAADVPTPTTAAPIIELLAGQTNTEGDSVSLQVVANDPDGHMLRFTDDGTLPNGLRIDATSGLISGTIANGTVRDEAYQVMIRAVDTEGQVANMGFAWMVLPAAIAPAPTASMLVELRQNGTVNHQQAQFHLRIRNTSGGSLNNLAVRVYFTVDTNQNASDYILDKYWDQSGAATITEPQQMRDNIYYFTISYGNTTLQADQTWEYHGNLRLRNWSNSDASNDWWFGTGLTSGYSVTTRIPVYANGQLIAGQLPNGTTAPPLEPTPDPTQPPVEPTPDPTQPPVEPTPDPTQPPAEPTPDPTQPPTTPDNASFRMEIQRNGPQNAQQTQFQYTLTNTGTSAQSNISVRIYFTVDNGENAANYVLDKYWDQSGSASISAPVGIGGNTYYFNISYSGSLPAGQSWVYQGNLRLNNWVDNNNTSNDWWTNGGLGGRTTTNRLPVFVGGTLVHGNTP